MFGTLLSRFDEETLSMGTLTYHDAFAILKKAIACYFISISILNRGPDLSGKQVASSTASFKQ